MVKNLPANAGDADSIPGAERSPGEGNSNPLQYSCLGNHMDRRAWWATVHGVAKESDITEQLNNSNVSSSSVSAVLCLSLFAGCVLPSRVEQSVCLMVAG